MDERLNRVGILGGGQLGGFLCAAARDLGVHTTIFTSDAGDPACRFADQTIIAPEDDTQALERLIAAVDVVSFEKEAVPEHMLRHLILAMRRDDVRVSPSPQIMLLLQNKARQKAWLRQQGFPCAPFLIVEEESIQIRRLIDELGLPLVQKTLRGGYDGRGVQILRSVAQCEALWPAPSLVETYVPRALEMAVLVARTDAGQLRTYPPVALHFDDNKHVLMVAESPASVSDKTAQRVIGLAEDIITRLNGVGVFAVELFLTPDDALLVNEISPRVHNSGHHTLESCETSQFEQHMRAVTRRPLGATEQHRAAATRNLLCGPEIERLCARGVAEYATNQPDTYLHWYGKSSPRDGRKLGHITSLGTDTMIASARTKVEIERLSSYTSLLRT